MAMTAVCVCDAIMTQFLVFDAARSAAFAALPAAREALLLPSRFVSAIWLAVTSEWLPVHGSLFLMCHVISLPAGAPSLALRVGLLAVTSEWWFTGPYS